MFLGAESSESHNYSSLSLLGTWVVEEMSSQLPAPAAMPATCCHASPPRCLIPLEPQPKTNSFFPELLWSWRLTQQPEVTNMEVMTRP